jgi:hypothetical protein
MSIIFKSDYRDVHFSNGEPHSGSSGRFSAWVDLNSRFHKVFQEHSGVDDPRINSKYVEWDRTPKFKTEVIAGEKISYYEYAGGWDGRKCRIQVVEGSPRLIGWSSQRHRGEKAKEARAECIKELEAEILKPRSEEPPVDQGEVRRNVEEFLNPIGYLFALSA